jgi:hypothetical protein
LINYTGNDLINFFLKKKIDKKNLTRFHLYFYYGKFNMAYQYRSDFARNIGTCKKQLKLCYDQECDCCRRIHANLKEQKRINDSMLQMEEEYQERTRMRLAGTRKKPTT